MVKMTVTTYKAESFGWEKEATKCIDHALSSDRKWLASHTFWAMRNQRKVVLDPMNHVMP